jgi:hypothetical protein
MAEQAKILYDEVEENNLGEKAMNERWARWHACSLCEQKYHGVVRCALGWACWKTYVGRPEAEFNRLDAMTLLGNGLCVAKHYKDALAVMEAELSVRRRLYGDDEEDTLRTQGNLATTYHKLGRLEHALQMDRDVYSGYLKLYGKESEITFTAASNYAASLIELKRIKEGKSLLRKTMPVARRVLDESHDLTLRMRLIYAGALYEDADATLDELREAVTTLEDSRRIARRVLGAAHPLTSAIERHVQKSRAALRARETPPPSESV